MCKLKYIPLIFLCCFISVPAAQSANIMLQKGNDLYIAKNYNKAIEVYENLVEQGYEGPELFYNLGNAYYRTGRLGYAILYYEKALKLNPSDEDIQHNLALANLQTTDKIETMPRFFIFQWWEFLLALFSVSGWTITGYIFYILLLTAVVVYFFSRKPIIQKYSVYSSLAFAILLVFSISILSINIHRQNSVKKGIVVEQTATAKLSPDNKSNDAFVIHEGIKVNIEDKVSNWLKVRLQDGKIGWLPQDNLKVI